jgi:hypothetical protein
MCLMPLHPLAFCLIMPNLSVLILSTLESTKHLHVIFLTSDGSEGLYEYRFNEPLALARLIS